MRRTLRTIGLALFLVLALSTIVWAQSQDTPADPNAIALLLAPMLAAATAIERIIEMLFNWYESTILNTGELLSAGKGYLNWAQDQVQKWRKAVQWERLSGEALRQAEDALEDAEERLVGYLKSPEYTSRKAVLSAIAGILLGLLIGFMTQLRMFHMLGIEIARPWIDMLITGLIIGTGSAPVHSLIGLLQKTKSAVEEARSLWSGQAYNQAIDAELKRVGLQSDLQSLRDLKQQMQDVLEAIHDQEQEQPGVMAAATVEGEPLAPRPATRGAIRTPRTMGNAELDRRVRRILG